MSFNLAKFRQQHQKRQEVVRQAAISRAHNIVTKTIINGWRQRAKRDAIPFLLTQAQLAEMWVGQNGHCAVTGRMMTVNKNDPCKVSLDRVDPSMGYSANNVRFVCTSVNFARHTMSDDDLRKMLRDMQHIDSLRKLARTRPGAGNWLQKLGKQEWASIFGRGGRA